MVAVEMRRLITLIEGLERPNVLFHGTTPRCAVQILATDTLQAAGGDLAVSSHGPGVSFSRSFDFAASYRRNSIVFIVDMTGLSTVPVDYWRGQAAQKFRDEEDEEFFPGSLTDLRSRLVGITSKKVPSYDVYAGLVMRMYQDMEACKTLLGGPRSPAGQYIRNGQLEADRTLWQPNWHSFLTPAQEEQRA